MKRILLLFILQLGLAYGQTKQQSPTTQLDITGSVSTIKNVKLPYATVRLLRDTVVLAATSCDSSGKFEFHPSAIKDSGLSVKAYYLKLSSNPVRITSGKAVINLVINDNTHQLAEVTITSDKPIITRKADRYIFIPNKSLTEGSSALDLLRHAPMINYDERSEEISIINKPGTIVYINNKKTTIPKEMLLQMLRSLPASDIKNVEVITNPGSEYSANTTGGIININLRRQSYEGWLGNLALQSVQSNYNTTMLNGSVSYRKGKLAVQLIPFLNSSYNYYTRDNLLAYTNGLTEKINTDHFRRYNVVGGGLNADYDINDRNFISVKTWSTNVYGNSTTNALTHYSTVGHSRIDSVLSSPASGTDFYRYSFANLNYHYNVDTAHNAYLDFNLDFNHFSQRQNNDGSFQTLDNNTGELKTTGQYQNNLPQNFNNLSERVEFGETLSASLKLSAGLQYSNTRVENDLKYYNLYGSAYSLDNALSNDYAYSEKYWAGFVSFNKDFSKQWNASLGLRAEGTNYLTEVKNSGIRKDSVYTNLFPSLAVGFSPDAKNQFGYSLSRKIIRPNIELLFPGRTYTSANYFTENNPFLQPSLFYNHDLSYTYNSKYSADLSYSVADNSYSSFVIPVEEDNTAKLKETYLNYGSAKNLSLVLNASQSFFKDFWEVYLTPYLNYARYRGEVSGSNIDIESYNFNLVYDNYFFLSRKAKWTAFLTFKYNGRNKDISGSVLNATTSLDFELKKVYKKLSFYLIATDLFNGSSVIKNNQYANYLLVQNYSATNSYNRSVLLKVRYSFGNNQLKGNKDRNTANQEIRNRAN